MTDFACEPGTGWMHCAHAEHDLTVCRCRCTCVSQEHCPLLDELGHPLQGASPNDR